MSQMLFCCYVEKKLVTILAMYRIQIQHNEFLFTL